MSEHSHHHHHHHQDYFDKEVKRNLTSIRFRKAFGKWLFRILCVVAVGLAITAIILYRM